MQTTKERAASGERQSIARQQEYMSLAEGVGIIPEEFRNRGYDKLDFGPGEGGILLSDKPKDEPGVRELLAALASGADPKQYAKQMLGETPVRARRGRHTTEEA